MNSARFTSLLLGFCVLLVSSVRADTITWVLTQSNLGAGFSGPFASLTLGWSGNSPSSTATVTFQSLADGSYIYLMGDGGSVALNIDGPWAIDGCVVGNNPPNCAGVTGSNSLAGFNPGPYQLLGPGNVSEFGSFNLLVKSFDGFTHSATEITFTLTNTGGTWADAISVLKPNAEGEIAAIHAFACVNSPDPCSQSVGAIATGYAAGAFVVPEPASLVLLGSGLLGGWLRRRSRAGPH